MEENIQNHSLIVMFRGTPCSWRVYLAKSGEKFYSLLYQFGNKYLISDIFSHPILSFCCNNGF